MNTVAPILQLEGVQLAYQDLVAVWDVSLIAMPGSACGIVGPNGAGKSTLCAGIAGLLKPRKGRVLMDGEDVSKHEPWVRAAAGVALVPEGKRIFRGLSIEANVQLAAQAAFRSGREARAAVDEALGTFPVLASRRSTIAGSLSGGQQQMLAIAQAFARRPRLIVIDEPSSGLAPVVVDEILSVVDHMKAASVAVVLVEQPELIAGRVENVIVMSQGRVRAAGPIGEIDLDTVAIEAYLGEAS